MEEDIIQAPADRDADAVRSPEDELKAAVTRYEDACKANDGYMPVLATRFRIIADELADKYPDDTNGGRRGRS